MSPTTRTLAVLATAALLAACDAYVSGVDDPIDAVNDDRLDDPAQIPFVINGVQAQFSFTYEDAALLGGGLSDELIFDDRVPTSTFPSFRAIDQGEIAADNVQVEGFFDSLGELRFLADDLVRRVNALDFSGADPAVKDEALYVGQLYGGLARYLYAAYFGLGPDEGGGVLDGGPFIPSAEMFDLAVADFDSARANGFAGEYENRLLNSLAARAHLYKAAVSADPQADYRRAQALAEGGLAEGDPPFQELHSTESGNEFFFVSGPGRAQYMAAFRFADAAEVAVAGAPEALDGALDTARVALYTISGSDADGNPVPFYMQGLYLERGSPIDVMTWQENALMLAELALRLDGDGGRALGLVNGVRASHRLPPLASVALDGDGPGTIVREREMELFVTGARLVDQRRFGLPFDAPGPWRYLPITQNERNQNPNL
jgi:hypothetical protein